MGIAGLDIAKLSGLLERIHVQCILVEGDDSHDHCVLQLLTPASGVKESVLVYENQGHEPRIATIKVVSRNSDGYESRLDQVGDSQRSFQLSGSRRKDPNRIFNLVKSVLRDRFDGR